LARVVAKRKAEVVFPTPPLGDTNAIVGMTSPQSIFFKQRKDTRKLSEFKRLSEGHQTVVGRLHEFRWIPEG
jgi:hypothetical protein